MLLNIEVNFLPNGYCEAWCPEMGLSTSGQSIEEALDKMRNLLAFYISTAQEMGLDAADRQQLTKQLRLAFKDKNFLLPPRPKVH